MKRALKIVLTVSGVAIAILAGFALRSHTRAAERERTFDRPHALSAQARAFIGDVAPGAKVERWDVREVFDSSGPIAFVLAAGGGAPFRVDVFRRDDAPDAPKPIAATSSLGLYLHNVDDRRQESGAASDQEQQEATQALARALGSREAAHAPLPPLPTLRNPQH